jgi:hypothetical protein
MYRINLLLLMIICFVLPARGQHEGMLVVRNTEDNTTVSGVHLKTIHGAILAVTDADGKAKLNPAVLPQQIHISHLAFADTIIWMTPSASIREIRVKPALSMLKPFSVYAKPVNLIPDKPWFVTSYVHTTHGLLLLAYPQRKLSNQSLFLLNFDNEVITAVPFREQGDLVLDATKTLWLKTKTFAYSVQIYPDTIKIGEEVIPTADYEAGLERIALVTNDQYYFGHYTCDHQRLDYYCFNAPVDKVILFETVFDHLGMRLRETRDIFETNEFERRFGDMCFFRPVFAPLYKTAERLLMINYAEGKLMYYDSLPALVQEVKLPWHQLKSLKREVLYDQATGKFYALFEANGLSSIREIILNTGSLGPEIKVPDFPYIGHLSVNQGQLYFLYKEQTHHEFRKIYRLTLPVPEEHIANQ